jgi:hypothetical protein
VVGVAKIRQVLKMVVVVVARSVVLYHDKSNISWMM